MEDTMALLLTLVPCLPLAAAILTALLGPTILRQRSHYLVIGALLGSLLCSVLLFSAIRTGQTQQQLSPGPSSSGFEQVVTLWTWAVVDDAYDQPDQPAMSGALGEGGLRDLRVDVTLRADALTCVMLVMVTLVSTLVAFFAAGYMHGDRSFWRFFAYFGLFVFSMVMLVSVSNFVLLFVFWEAVGLCSYLLIGFWYHKPDAASAGKKAFLVNRVGDFGFTLAIFLIWMTYGTLNFHDSLRDGTTDAQVVATAMEAGAEDDATSPVVHGVLGRWRIAGKGYVGGAIGLAICALLLLGACGKSAQFPLHVWLPDAMEGPTPVSALIHAATMVTAGVYMIARCTPLFMASPPAQLLVACVGGGTALLAALIALTQYDLKRVLAFSTVSQLGYMLLGLGVGTFGGITAGMFHLLTHAFFKALLFLGAGSVMHAMGNIIDMRRFGGLRKRMPITHVTFFIGCLALAGFPGLSGFWSKDAIVAAVHEKSHELRHAESSGESEHHTSGRQHNVFVPVASSASATAWLPDAHRADENDQAGWYAEVYEGLYFLALLTGFLTAFYTFRALYLTFYGPEEIPYEASDHAHESPPIMYWPLRILAIGAASIGFLLDQTWRRQPNHLFSEFLASTPSLADGAVAETRLPFAFHSDVAAASGAIALAGILLATYFYLGGQREIRWLKAVLDLAAFSGTGTSSPLDRLAQLTWVGAIHRGATKLGMGWLTAACGRVVGLLLLVISGPLMLGNFISPYKLSYGKFFVDELYHFLIVLPLRAAAWLSFAFDRWIVDGAVEVIGRVPRLFGQWLRSAQTGLLPFYAIAMVLGIVALLASRLLWAG